MKIRFEPYPIQYKALEYLWDDVHTEIFFGGAARVSKTYLACAFAVIECLKWPGIHVSMGRSRLSYLKKTTFLTLYEFFEHQGLKEGKDFNYNGMENIISFPNGSKIIFLELYHNPSDPNFERLMSLSLTHVIIDEGSQISKKAYDALSSRISYKTQEYGILGKILIVSNPTKGWLYDNFYVPYKENRLEAHKAVILGTPMDNPTAGKAYIEQQLKTLSEPVAQRLIYGNWDYADEDYSVFKYEDLINCFHNEVDSNEKYISADIADIGGDRTVIAIWRGLEMIDLIVGKWPTDEVERKITDLIKLHKIKVQNVVIDSDGLGVGVANRIKGCYMFKNGSSPLNKENFRNLKTQCIIKMQEFVEKHEVKFMDKYRDEIINECQLIRYGNIEGDRVEIESKGKLKKRYGKSPDIFDSIMMRFVFTIKKRNKIVVGF